MPSQEDHARSISETLSDYRTGEIPPRTHSLVKAWAAQFPSDTQEPLLAALDRTLQRSYLSQAKITGVLHSLAARDYRRNHNDPAAFWRSASFLDIQGGVSSQRSMLTLFSDIIGTQHGFQITRNQRNADFQVYLDDLIVTGARLRNDLREWINDGNSKETTVLAIAPIVCTGSSWVEDNLNKGFATSNKKVSLYRRSAFGRFMRTALAEREYADVLWPVSLPQAEDAISYSEYLAAKGHPPRFRNAGHPGDWGCFANDSDKRTLENALLVRGSELKASNDLLPETVRPLGYSILDTFGSGLMTIPYRNCPNSAPIALWVDGGKHPPLLPRRTNRQSLR